MVELSEIEKRVDRAVTATIPITTSLGGINPENYGQMMEFAKTMATCRAGIPNWLRASVGDCLMICSRALRWGMDPYFVAEKSYLMENKRTGESKVGYESQLIHAVIESLAPLKGRLRHEIKGEGDDRYCVITGTFKGEDQPHVYESEKLGKRLKDIGKSDSGNFRGSPLWLTKPTVQLFYDASRDWARINCPDVLAGVYTRDELPDHEPVDVTPKVASFADRLSEAKQARAKKSFDPDHIDRVIEGSVNNEAASKEAEDDGSAKRPDPVSEERQDGDGDRAAADRDEGGSPELVTGDQGDGGSPVGEAAARPAQAESGEGEGGDEARAAKPKGKRK